MAKKEISNLFSNFDEVGTEANDEIVKNSIKNTTAMKDKVKLEALKDISKTYNLMEQIAGKTSKNKLEMLASNLPKKDLDKKSYMTVYLRKSVQKKIDEISKKLGVSNGSVIELLLKEYQ